MTYHLAAFRLHSIGERSARFTDLTLDFTAPHTAVKGPADTVVWLRNGGGKSSLLSLFYALVLPRAIDFMGRVAKRSLTDYVGSSDTSHTIAVWHPAVSDTLDGEPDRVLITGAVYEWADLRRPADADRARDKLDTTFYAFYAVPGVLDLDRLPILDETGAPQRRSAYLTAIREVAAIHPQAMDLVITDRQHEWATALNNRGLDPSLFRTQKQMNHVEGGVEDLFRFSSAREFVDLLIDLTVAPDDVANVADRLSSIASLLATKPTKTAERDFCLDAATGLDKVIVAQEEVEESTEALRQATEEAAELAAAFAATIADAETQIGILDERRKEIDVRRATADSEQKIAYDLVYLYEKRATEMRVAIAEEQAATAQRAIDDAADLIEAWEAAEHLAAKAHYESALEKTRQEADEERKRSAPQRRDHDEHAALLRTRLLSLATDHDSRAENAAQAAEAAREQSRKHRERAREAQRAAEAADKDATKAATLLESLTTDLRAAARDGVLPTEDTDPAAYDATLAEQMKKLGGTLDAVRTRRARRPQSRNELTDRLTALTEQRTQRDEERSRLAAERAALAERAAALAVLGRVRDLTEATDDAPVDLWAEAGTLMRRLSDAILGIDLALVRLEVDRIDDQRTIDVHARTGLLPTTRDAERIQTLLSEHGITAETGWSHLRTLIPGTRFADALADPDLARLGVGLVIPTEQADAAATTLAAVDAATTALVGVYTAQAASTIVRSARAHLNGTGPVWTGLQRGLVDTTAAETTVRQVSARTDAYNARKTELTTARDADRRLLDDLTSFLAECPAGHLDSLANRLDDLDKTITEIDGAIDRVNAALDDLNKAEAEDTALEQKTQSEITRIEKARARLAGLIPKSKAAAGWQEDLIEAKRRSSEAHELFEWHSEQADRAVTTAGEKDSLARANKQTADDYRAEAAGVTFLDTEPEVADDPRVSLEILRSRYRDAERAGEIQAARSVLAERERTLTAALAEKTRALAAVPENVRQRAAALLTTTDGQTKETRAAALAAARQAEKEAIRGKERVTGDIRQHTATLEKIRGRRADPPRRPLPVEPTDPEHADALAIEHDRIGQNRIEQRTKAERELEALDRRQDALRNRVNAFGLLADGLPDPTGRSATPFSGDDADARTRKQAVIEKMRAAEQRATTAATTRATTVTELRAIGGKYPSVATPAKDRVLHDREEILAQHAEELAAQLRLRAEMIDGELAGIEKDQAIVTASLAHLVSNTLDTLRKAERYSRVDTQTGGWSGKRMLRISFDAPASDADLRIYTNRVIERRIAGGVKPEGLPLLKDAVHEAVGPRGFTVKVLKPTLDMIATTEDITRLGKWSGGEKLTVCVALYCTIAALRAANAGRKDRSGGVLLLDNPIGRASHGSLVRLQRAVAAAHKVQLGYTTGVKDPDAVSQFPNVIRLDNRPGRTRHRRYIVLDATSAPDRPDQRFVTGVRVAHDESTEMNSDETDTEATG